MLQRQRSSEQFGGIAWGGPHHYFLRSDRPSHERPQAGHKGSHRLGNAQAVPTPCRAANSAQNRLDREWCPAVPQPPGRSLCPRAFQSQISRTRLRCTRSRGLRPSRRSQSLKSLILTECSTATFITETLRHLALRGSRPPTPPLEAMPARARRLRTAWPRTPEPCPPLRPDRGSQRGMTGLAWSRV